MEVDLQKIFNRLKKDKFKICGPKEKDGEVCVLELDKMPEAKFFGRLTARPWKYYLMPPRQPLAFYKKNKAVLPKINFKKTALFGMNILDLKALEFYDRVFKNDFYYQKNRKKLLIIGISDGPLNDLKTNFFETDGILENVVFDIFCELPLSSRATTSKGEGKPRDLVFYSGSPAGSKLLKKCGLKFKRVKYSPRKIDKKILKLKEAVENSAENKLWDELGEICLACGKCTIVCPTCFCFDLESSTGPIKKMDRASGNCFYDDFTRIAGGHKFLNNPKEKIFFWYFHKFVRNVRDYNLPGCVDCGRCTAVCPVGIDINKNIQRLLKENKV